MFRQAQDEARVGRALVRGSGNANYAQHTGGGVFQDVAVEQPVARRVGDEGDIHSLIWKHQQAVHSFLMRRQLPVARQDAERMPVQMDRVRPSGVVVQAQHIRLCSATSHLKGQRHCR